MTTQSRRIPGCYRPRSIVKNEPRRHIVAAGGANEKACGPEKSPRRQNEEAFGPGNRHSAGWPSRPVGRLGRVATRFDTIRSRATTVVHSLTGERWIPLPV